MPLVDEWKKAKTAFESATNNKKKPSAKLLGFIRKGTGIEDALKSVDSASNAADLKKALGKFETAASAYISTLTKAGSDPAAVPNTEKATYIAEVNKLKQQLEKLQAEGQGIAEELNNANLKGKDGANAADLKAAKAAREGEQAAIAHVKLREQAVQEAKRLVADFKGRLSEIDGHLANMNKHVPLAGAASKSGNRNQFLVELGLLERYSDEIGKIITKAEDDYHSAMDGKGLLMTARGDKPMGGTNDPALKSKGGALFKTITDFTNDLLSVRAEIQSKAGEARAAIAKAEAMGGAFVDPEKYVKQLTDIETQMKTLQLDVERKVEQMTNALNEFNSITPKPVQQQMNWYQDKQNKWKLTEPQLQGYKKKILAFRQELEHIPPQVTSDTRIAQLQSALDKQTQASLDEVELGLHTGGRLSNNISLQRNKLAKAPAGR